ncbi:MAG: GNAT family N-acetyltransferase [Gammaproteobacteria bacterium]|nr:GNAT family N-acetyltransferase [Gammaproteobacteria bacterium]
MKLDIVSDAQQFHSLASAWNHLNQQSIRGTIFSSWDWHYSWWQFYSQDQDLLRILCFSVDQRLVGILPLYCRRQRLGLPPATYTLRFTGTGEPRPDEVASEYLDVLTLPEFEEEIADAAIAWMHSFKEWQDVTLNCLLEGSALSTALERQSGNTHLYRQSVGSRYQVPLAGGQASFFDRLGTSRVKRLQRSLRAADKAGGVRYESIESAEEIDNFLEELAVLSHERQTSMNRKSVFSSQCFTLFHHQLVRRLYEQGKCDIHKLFIGHRLMAMLYCFYDRHTSYYYQSGFASREANRYQPLSLAHLWEMDSAHSAGRQHYDLMRGETPCYKDEFGCDLTPMENVYLFRSNYQRAQYVWLRSCRAELVHTLKKAGVERRHS